MKFIDVICVVSEETSVTSLHSINRSFYNWERVCSLHYGNLIFKQEYGTG